MVYSLESQKLDGRGVGRVLPARALIRLAVCLCALTEKDPGL